MSSPPLMIVPFEGHASPPSTTISRSEGLGRAIVGKISTPTMAKAMLKFSLSKANSASGPRRVLLLESDKPTKPASAFGTFARPKIPLPTLATVYDEASVGASGISKPAFVSAILPLRQNHPFPPGLHVWSQSEYTTFFLKPNDAYQTCSTSSPYVGVVVESSFYLVIMRTSLQAWSFYATYGTEHSWLSHMSTKVTGIYDSIRRHLTNFEPHLSSKYINEFHMQVNLKP